MSILTLQEVRDEGFTSAQYPDSRVNDILEELDAYIEELTGNFFEPRTLTFDIDGDGTHYIFMPYPIVSITSVKEDGVSIDLDSLKVYNRHLKGLRHEDQDDRVNPKIEFNQELLPRYVDSYRGHVRLFTKGVQNFEIVGVFAYRDYDPNDLVNGKIPVMLKRAAKMLLPRFLPTVNSPTFSKAWTGHNVKRIRTRTQECEMGGALVNGSLVGTLTGDYQIDQLLSRFVSPVSGTIV